MLARAHDKAQKLSLSIKPFHFNKEETLPVSKKKRTTSTPDPSTSDTSTPCAGSLVYPFEK